MKELESIYFTKKSHHKVFSSLNQVSIQPPCFFFLVLLLLFSLFSLKHFNQFKQFSIFHEIEFQKDKPSQKKTSLIKLNNFHLFFEAMMIIMCVFFYHIFFI